MVNKTEKLSEAEAIEVLNLVVNEVLLVYSPQVLAQLVEFLSKLTNYKDLKNHQLIFFNIFTPKDECSEPAEEDRVLYSLYFVLLAIMETLGSKTIDNIWIIRGEAQD